MTERTFLYGTAVSNYREVTINDLPNNCREVACDFPNEQLWFCSWGGRGETYFGRVTPEGHIGERLGAC